MTSNNTVQLPDTMPPVAVSARLRAIVEAARGRAAAPVAPGDRLTVP